MMASETPVNSAAALFSQLIDIAFETAKYIHKEVVIYKEQKQLSNMENINKFYEIYLKDLLVSEGSDFKRKVVLPPVFRKIMKSDDEINAELSEHKELSKDKKPRDKPPVRVQYESFKLDKDLIKYLSTVEPRKNVHPDMRKYIQHIKDAINLMLRYNQKRLDKKNQAENDSDDITASVICYILLMLSEHCLQFQGTHEECEYIEKFSLFVNEFASIRPITSYRFQKLTDVFSTLKLAEKEITNFNKIHYPDDLNNSLIGYCDKTILSLIRCYIKFLIESKYWPDATTAIPTDIAKGILSPPLINSGFLKNEPEVTLPDKIIFSDWIKQLTKDYLYVSDQRVLEEGETFELKLGKFEYETYDELNKDELKKLNKFFDNNIYFKRYNANKYKHRNLSEIDQIKHDFNVNMRILYDFANLINFIIAIRYSGKILHACSSKARKDYIKNADNSTYIFTIFKEITELSRASNIRSLHTFTKISDALQKNSMLDAKKLALLLDIKNLFRKDIEQFILKTTTSMIETHDINVNDKERQGVVYVNKYKMLQPFRNLEKGFKIKTGYNISEEDPGYLDNNDKDTDEEPSKSLSRMTVIDNNHEDIFEEYEHKSCVTTQKMNSTSSPYTINPHFSTSDDDYVTRNRKLTYNSCEVKPPKFLHQHFRDLIDALKKEDDPNPHEIRVFENLTKNIIRFQLYGSSLSCSNSHAKKIKGEGDQKLSETLINITTEHLEKNKAARQASFQNFCTKIKRETHDSKNTFLDRHESDLSQGLLVAGESLASIFSLSGYYWLKRGTLFSPHSRTLIHNMGKQFEKDRIPLKPIKPKT